MIIITMVARTVGMTGRWRCAVLLSPRLGNLPCRRRGGKNAARKKGRVLVRDGTVATDGERKSPHAPR